MYIGYPTRINFEDLAIGDIVIYKNIGGEAVRVRIEHLEPELKNERSGFVGVKLDENNNPVPNTSQIDDHPYSHVWGYTAQITQKVSA